MADQALQAAIKTFKTAAVYTRAAAPLAPITISGVFDQIHEVVESDFGSKIDTVHPTFGVRLADLPAAPAPGDHLAINGKTYEFLKSEEDGEGGSRLILTRLT